MLGKLKNYLSVTKKQWNGLVVLMLLIALVLATPYVYQKLHKNKVVNLNGFDAAVAKLKRNSAIDSTRLAIKGSRRAPFNPNNLPLAGWQKLGLSQHQIDVINNYQSKGGKFYSKQDLQKIYVITPDDYKRLAPYINLPDKPHPVEKTNAVVEINTATITQLTQIKGIGQGWAKSIIRYRDRLGGLHDKEQLKEIYGMDKFTYSDIAPFIKVNAGKIKQMNINTITVDDLLVFPYLNFKQRNALVEYRNQHGNYTKFADLLNIPIFNAQILRKIEPYFIIK